VRRSRVLDAALKKHRSSSEARAAFYVGVSDQATNFGAVESVITFDVGAPSRYLILESSVVRHLESHRQLATEDREAGGQLFATFSDGDVIIREASGPRPTDHRTRTSYCADRKAEQNEILERHERGLHYVGDWHTHPSRTPRPSHLDYLSIRETFRRSTHRLDGFILMVVGTLPRLKGLHVSVNTADQTVRLQRTGNRKLEADGFSA
jgi:integrative and conjugative element protein (TIGR02256 family)